MKAKRRGCLFPVLVVVLVLFWAFLELVAPARERARRRMCYSNLRCAIGYASHLYSGDFGERFPPSIGHLYPHYNPTPPGFLCPSAGKATALPDDPRFTRVYASGWKSWSSGAVIDGKLISPNDSWYTPAKFAHTDYVYVSGLKATDPPVYVLAFDDEWNHDGEGFNVLFIGSNVEWMNDFKWLHEQLARQEKELAAKGREMKLLRPAWSSWPDPPAGWPRLWYTRRNRRAVAVGAFVGVAVALALVVRKVRRGRRDGGPGDAE